MNRYARHLILDGFGTEAQAKLLASSVLVIGAGGLGSPALLYLASAGIGRITIVDDDEVDLSNLQRQVIHSEETIGVNKAESAKKRLIRLNSTIEIKTITTRADQELLEKLVKTHDFVLDSTDNFATKHLINRVCVKLHKPFNHAAIMHYSGQTMTVADGSACLACLFDEPKDTGKKEGILCTVPAVLGTIQATEAIKYLSGVGELLIGKMLYFDAKTTSFRTMSVRKNPNCKVCNDV